MRNERAIEIVATLALASALLAGCQEEGTTARTERAAPVAVETALHHEPGCPLSLDSAVATLSDETLTFMITVRSATKLPITSFALRCAVKDVSRPTPRPIGPPTQLSWTGLLEPGARESVTLATVLQPLKHEGAIISRENLRAELEPAEVTYESGGEWKRTGPVAQ